MITNVKKEFKNRVKLLYNKMDTFKNKYKHLSLETNIILYRIQRDLDEVECRFTNISQLASIPSKVEQISYEIDEVISKYKEIKVRQFSDKIERNLDKIKDAISKQKGISIKLNPIHPPSHAMRRIMNRDKSAMTTLFEEHDNITTNLIKTYSVDVIELTELTISNLLEEHNTFVNDNISNLKSYFDEKRHLSHVIASLDLIECRIDKCIDEYETYERVSREYEKINEIYLQIGYEMFGGFYMGTWKVIYERYMHDTEEKTRL